MNAVPTPTLTTKSPMNAAYESYIKQGFHLVPIAPGTKGPKTPNWNRQENCLTDASKIPDTLGVGLAHAFSGTASIDIDDWKIALATLGIVGIDLQALLDAPDSVTIESGNPGHAKLIYRLPFGLVLPSKKLIHTTPEGIRKNFIDFRCATADGLTVQDVLPSAAKHPATGRPYIWSGNGHYTAIPTIPTDLLAYWRSIIDAEEQRNINVQGSQVSASWDEIKQALAHITPDCERSEWITVLMALHHAGTVTQKLDEALALADEWSSQSETKYKGQQDILNSWRGFKPDGGVTLGSLFHLAGQSGWTRPMPDVSTLFASVAKADVVHPKSIIDSFHVPAPNVDFDLLPPLLATRAQEVGISMGCDPLIAVWSGLAAASAAVDARTRLELMDGWEVPPVLWLVTIGPPADRKTPASKPMLSILKTLEIEDRIPYAAQVKIYEAKASAYGAAMKAFNAASADPSWLLGGEDTTLLPFVPPTPVPPQPLRLTVSDITSQKLVRMCADRPRGLLCHLDEMRSWADKLVTPQSGESRSTWVEAYDSGTGTMDRVGNGSTGAENNIIADNFAVSIYGNMQPRVFKDYLKPLTQDGLIQRFIPAILQSKFSDVKGEPIPKHLSHHAQYEQHIRVLFALPATNYKLSPEAHTLFRKFQDWYHTVKKDERTVGADDSYMTALGKIEGTCGRLILFWHLFQDPHNLFVSEHTADQAITFVQTYVINAMRYSYGEVGGLTTDSIDQGVAEYILQHASIAETVSMSEIKRSLRRRIENMHALQQNELIREAMGVLERSNWVKLMHADSRTATWAIDPRLANYFPDHRLAVIAAKQRLYDVIHATSGGKAPHYKVKGSELLTAR